MDIRVRVEAEDAIKKLKATPDALQEALESWRNRGSQLVRGVMVEVIRSKQKAGTGYLGNSVTIRPIAGGFEVGPMADYGEFVDQPTKPHIIRPVRRKALAFARSGGVITRSQATGHVRTRYTFGGRSTTTGPVFARSVFHPGTKGMFFIDATAARVEEPLGRLLDEDVDRRLKTLEQS